MTIPLLRTKLLFPPLPAGVVLREGLLDQLDLGLAHGSRLTLISAQAGAGKTTLLASWIHQRLQGRGLGRGWLTLDSADNQPARYLTYLLAALQQAAPVLDDSMGSALTSPQPPPVESLLTGLINQLDDLQAPLVLFLDDYHLIETLAIHQALGFLIEHQPSTLHLVVASRADPPLPLARLRARNQLTELRATDLRFTAREAAIFLNESMGLQLAAAEVAALEARTEGWIAGMQLAALALRGKDNAAAASFIAVVRRHAPLRPGLSGRGGLPSAGRNRADLSAANRASWTACVGRCAMLSPSPGQICLMARRCWSSWSRTTFFCCPWTRSVAGFATIASLLTCSVSAWEEPAPPAFPASIAGLPAGWPPTACLAMPSNTGWLPAPMTRRQNWRS